MELLQAVVGVLAIGLATGYVSPSTPPSPVEPKALPRIDTKIVHLEDGGGGSDSGSGSPDHQHLVLPKEKSKPMYYFHSGYHQEPMSNRLKGPHIVIEETHEEVSDPDSPIKTEEILIPVSEPHHSKHMKMHHPSMVKIENPRSPIMLHMVSPSMRRKHESSIPDLLAILAPLAAIPLLGSLAVSSFTTMLTLTGLGGRRRKRDITIHDQVLDFISGKTNHTSPYYPSNHTSNNFENILTKFDDQPEPPVSSAPPNMSNFEPFNKTSVPISELFQLDIVQQYLRQSGRPDHNDEIIASYLACRGMFAGGNHCLERLACHYADSHHGRLRPLERDVAALIIYSLLRNGHIDSSFKRRLQRAALFGYDHHHQQSESSGDHISFVPLCDREFPCPKSDMS